MTTPDPDAPPEAPEPPDAFDRAAAWLMNHGALPALAVLTIVLAGLYSKLFLGEPVGDDLTFHFAESARIADCLRSGDFDFWNPSANAGYASAYYYQVIPQLASAIPAALFGHHLFWFQLSVVLPLILVPLAGYRGMRLMGATPWQSVIAGGLIALTVGQSRWGHGSDGTFSVGLYTQTWALAAFPLALGHGVRWLRTGLGLVPAIAWGTFVGLCHPFSGVSLAVTLAVGVAAGLVTRIPWVRPNLATSVCLMVFGGGLFLAYTTWGNKPTSEITAVVAIAAIAPVLGLAGRRDVRDHLVIAWIAFGIVALAIVALIGASAIARAVVGVELQRTLLHVGIIVAVIPSAIGMILMLVRPRVPERPQPRDPEPWWREPSRLIVLGALLLIATMPGWLTLYIDSDGWGGFPHRVDDEVGPGFTELGRWFATGAIFDYQRWTMITCALAIVLIAARDAALRWLWPAGFGFAALLGLGPHMPKTSDDLIPAVRFLGAMQIVFALAVGAGAFAIGRSICNITEDAPLVKFVRRRYTSSDFPAIQFWLRTTVAAVTAVCLVGVMTGLIPLYNRLRPLRDDSGSHRPQLMKMIELLASQPQGRKQAGAGATNHWWNQLPYVYGRVPALWQLGGGGLQASPNYTYLWHERSHTKNAYLYDAPYVVFQRDKASQVPAGETIGTTANYELRRLPSPGLVSPIQIIEVLPADKARAHARAIEWVKSDLPLRDQVYVYSGFGGVTGPPAGTTLRSWRQDSPGDAADMYAEVEVDKPTAFMARESWHPRWHAYVDGSEVMVRRVTPYFQAVDVPPGRHVIAFRFERPWWADAAWLAWPGTVLGTWLALLLLARWRGRRRLPIAAAIAR
ncbi:MAG: hypothetical protein AB7P03_20425 [Kofleriaceae bacterium]